MARSVEKRIEVLEKLYGTDTRAGIGLKGGGKRWPPHSRDPMRLGGWVRSPLAYVRVED